MASQDEVIETTVGKVAAELAKRGLDPDDPVTITIEPDALIPGRRARDRRRLYRRRHRPDDQAGAEGSRAAGWMRVVLDTNVLVSAALKQKSMPGMATLIVERRGGLLKSVAPEEQLFEVVARPYLASLIDPDAQAG